MRVIGQLRHGGRAAFTFIEMLTTVAILVILLGLILNTARHVRTRSAQALTKNLLRELDAAMAVYRHEHADRLPSVEAFPPPSVSLQGSITDEDAPGDKLDGQKLLEAATRNNANFVRALKARPLTPVDSPVIVNSFLNQLPISIYDGENIRDAWGSPVVFMPSKHPLVGTAPRDRISFFFSAGPDHNYLTRDDNLYSYEELLPTPSVHE